VGEPSPSFVRRVYVPQALGGDEYLRATFHEDEAVVVISHWRGAICVAATPVKVTDAVELVVLLTQALGHAAEHPRQPTPLPSARVREPWWRSWQRRLVGTPADPDNVVALEARGHR
jgi:hypothetical protein